MKQRGVLSGQSVRPALHLAARKISLHTGKLLRMPGQIVTTAINYGQSDTARTLHRHQGWLSSTATKNKETCLAGSSDNASDLYLEEVLFECGPDIKYLDRHFGGFPQYLQLNAPILLQHKPRPYRSISFQILTIRSYRQHSQITNEQKAIIPTVTASHLLELIKALKFGIVGYTDSCRADYI